MSNRVQSNSSEAWKVGSLDCDAREGMPRLAFVYPSGRLGRIDALRRGEAPSEFFYGAPELAAQGVGIATCEPSARPALFSSRLGPFLDRVFLHYRPLLVRIESLLNLWHNRGRFSGADVVVATGGTLALELMLLRRWQAGVPPVVGIQCGLTHHTPLGRRMDITRQLLAASHTILFAEGELGAMREKFAVPAERITVNQFGVDLTYWTSGDEDDEGYILSVGNDNRRDYETLMAAAAMIPSRVVVVTERTIETPVPANVTLHRGSWKTGPISDSDLREMYRNSRCVVVPLVESDQPSGQSVTLQAMACGKPVVLTRPTGLWNREHMEACEGVHLVSPGDAADLAAAIARIVSDPAGCTRQGGICREFVEEHGDIRSFAKRLLDWCGVAMESEGRKL